MTTLEVFSSENLDNVFHYQGKISHKDRDDDTFLLEDEKGILVRAKYPRGEESTVKVRSRIENGFSIDHLPPGQTLNLHFSKVIVSLVHHPLVSKSNGRAT